MTLTMLETQAALLARNAFFGELPRTPLAYDETRRDRINQAIDLWAEIFIRSNWDRLRKRAIREINHLSHYLTNWDQDRDYSREHRAKRREDNEAWEAAGYRVFNVHDSYTFSTQPFPFEYASSIARGEAKRLLEVFPGLQYRIESPDYEYHSVRCPYWGSTYSNPSGHVVILVKAATPIDLHIIRETYADVQDKYWREKHGYNNMRPHFRNW